MIVAQFLSGKWRTYGSIERGPAHRPSRRHHVSLKASARAATVPPLRRACGVGSKLVAGRRAAGASAPGENGERPSGAPRF